MGVFQSKPEIVTGLNYKPVRAGDTITLQCEANTEGLTVTWKKDGQKLQCLRDKHIMKQYGELLTLEIRNAEEKDEGEYTITLMNGKDTATSSVTVDLFLPKPEFVTDLADERVKVGDTITLQCEVNTEELTATWKKNEQKLGCVRGKHVMRQVGKSLSLKIKNVGEEDDGTYTITVKNRKHDATSSAILTVELDAWRKVERNQGEMVSTLKAFNIRNDKVKNLNLLLCGPIGAGKSSIINTINSILEGQISVGYQGCLESSESQTLQFHERQAGNAKNGFLPLVLNDTMGLENDQSNGVHPDDIITALKGHIKEGYTFKTKKPIDKNCPDYRENPSLSDRMHCLVYVIPADKISLMDKFFQKMKTVRDAAKEIDPDLPHVILLTRVDKACPLTNKNLRYIYNSKKIKDKMYECQHALDVKMYAIFPMKNYHEESDVNEDVNCLMLHALTRIVRWADNYADKFSNN